MSEMSNENHETIADIVREMKHDCPARHIDGTMYRDVDWVYTKGTVKRLADRIEAAANHQFRDTTKTMPEEVAVSKMETTTPTCSKSSQVGNAAAMREALVKADAAFRRIVESAWFIEANFHETKEVMDAGNAIEAALSAPPRNCDIMDWRTAWAKWRTECHPQKPCGYAEVVSGTEKFMDWYMSEAKGETK